ncbi:HAD hydrolase-like protein [Cryobacterium shii]|uniref:HAD hydrolase-like protein n=1 Tax=Cryobacterium shii TaxID=1259235 RepID=UPI003B978B1C
MGRSGPFGREPNSSPCNGDATPDGPTVTIWIPARSWPPSNTRAGRRPCCSASLPRIFSGSPRNRPGAQPNEVWVVGDDATTDIAMGNAAGATTVQVRTGKYPDQAAERATIRAAYAIDTIASLPGRGGVRARGRVAGLPVVRCPGPPGPAGPSSPIRRRF